MALLSQFRKLVRSGSGITRCPSTLAAHAEPGSHPNADAKVRSPRFSKHTRFGVFKPSKYWRSSVPSRYPSSTTTTMLLQEQITLWFQQLDLVQQQLNTVTQQLESKLESMSTMASASTTGTSGTNPPHPSDRDILASIPGVGTIVLANLLGEAGTAIRNRDHAALRCLTGVAPRHQTFREILSRPTPPSSKSMARGQCLSLGSRRGTSRSHLSTTIRSTEDARSYPWSSVTFRRRSPVSRRLRDVENRYAVPTFRRRNLTLTLFRSRYGLSTSGFRKKNHNQTVVS